MQFKLINPKDIIDRRLHYINSVIKNAWALKLWKDKMISSMAVYIDKVKTSIKMIADQATIVVQNTNSDYTLELSTKLAKEIEESYLWLDVQIAKMNSLIDLVCKHTGNNAALKAKVLELLEIMRKPKLPNISFLTINLVKKPHMMRRPFRR